MAVSHLVQQGKEPASELALRQLINEAQAFKGYKVILTVELSDRVDGEYELWMRFADEANYRAWEESQMRKDRADELPAYLRIKSRARHEDGLSLWPSPPRASAPLTPTKWKMAVLTWLAIYPLILLLSHLVGTHLTFLHPHVRLLIVSVILVSVMTYFLMPQMTRLFARWIF